MDKDTLEAFKLETSRKLLSLGMDFVKSHDIKIVIDDETIFGKYVRADDIRTALHRNPKNVLEMIKVVEIYHFAWAINNGLDN